MTRRMTQDSRVRAGSRRTSIFACDSRPPDTLPASAKRLRRPLDSRCSRDGTCDGSAPRPGAAAGRCSSQHRACRSSPSFLPTKAAESSQSFPCHRSDSRQPRCGAGRRPGPSPEHCGQACVLPPACERARPRLHRCSPLSSERQSAHPAAEGSSGGRREQGGAGPTAGRGWRERGSRGCGAAGGCGGGVPLGTWLEKLWQWL
ncbi:hypothetical protein T492DRAFT_407722 [Pavlovales sp. CCMP2436]|nr:hypothetical protein T492DRAFT_407722 [Pavlovales sp. CCMP2436]|mmetsp:Transcript_42880/g.99393  ORF Transcript_42880/g.99393 Transcript_42880/m.99393 type:complete len:203 (+) Transcript_42880:34-642(+)